MCPQIELAALKEEINVNQFSISTGKSLSAYFEGAITSKQDIWFKITFSFTFIHDPFIQIENTATPSDLRIEEINLY